jgi:hypothetical protein
MNVSHKEKEMLRRSNRKGRPPVDSDLIRLRTVPDVHCPNDERLNGRWSSLNRLLCFVCDSVSEWQRQYVLEGWNTGIWLFSKSTLDMELIARPQTTAHQCHYHRQVWGPLRTFPTSLTACARSSNQRMRLTWTGYRHVLVDFPTWSQC